MLADKTRFLFKNEGGNIISKFIGRILTYLVDCFLLGRAAIKMEAVLSFETLANTTMPKGVMTQQTIINISPT
jgi:hypothetical protein